MKKKILLLSITSQLLASSCNKTYVCKDQTQTITGEVKARTQSEANSRCQANNPNPMTATLK